MLTLATGLPGNGKTLFMLWYIAAKAKKENREVFYHNVKNLNTEAVGPWQEFEPEKWMELPNGSIILIDECQEVFERKPNGAKLPEHYQELAKHRHKGFDIFLITQHPTLIDNFVRRLVGQHFHSVRKFGLQRATIYEWSACNPSPETVSSQKSAVPIKWKYPVEVFGWYKSAEVHTVKRSIPAKVVLAALFIVAVVVFGYFLLDRYQHRYDKKPPDVVVPGRPGEVARAPLPASSAAGASPVQAVALDPMEDLRRYAYAQTPRVEALPQTAPKYDELTRPVRVPVPAMCIQKGVSGKSRQVSCRCWTQQGTAMHSVGMAMCMQIARDGFFQDFDPDRVVADRSQPGPAAPPPGAPVHVADSGPVVSVIPEVERPLSRVRLTGETKLK